mgnify:CR=1 FL=1
MNTILCIPMGPGKERARTAVALLRACGIKASTDARGVGRPDIWRPEGEAAVFILKRDALKVDKILQAAGKYLIERKKEISLPPEFGTLEYLDMLIHDCRQYLMIATGELKNIDEEGELALDDPTNDIEKITIRLKRLKGQCMKMSGRIGLDWETGGGMDR